ncbi:hypothetical protein B2J93_3461 [Marssonina coronariae]|uniref:Uncharacterized protein n=1 Tax=Diplocarpon coronariae TaxID=2795749 RepID=A0A218Z454_9HELO|nr:hypothetical protein B2J93_3461 [Marssonina coronariae]
MAPSNTTVLPSATSAFVMQVYNAGSPSFNGRYLQAISSSAGSQFVLTPSLAAASTFLPGDGTSYVAESSGSVA